MRRGCKDLIRHVKGFFAPFLMWGESIEMAPFWGNYVDGRELESGEGEPRSEEGLEINWIR